MGCPDLEGEGRGRMAAWNTESVAAAPSMTPGREYNTRPLSSTMRVWGTTTARNKRRTLWLGNSVTGTVIPLVRRYSAVARVESIAMATTCTPGLESRASVAASNFQLGRVRRQNGHPLLTMNTS